MNEMRNKKECPTCKRKTLIGHRQGDMNPNPVHPTTKLRCCLDCYVDSFYAKYGANG